jgi:hypothetical protein
MDDPEKQSYNLVGKDKYEGNNIVFDYTPVIYSDPVATGRIDVQTAHNLRSEEHLSLWGHPSDE